MADWSPLACTCCANDDVMLVSELQLCSLLLSKSTASRAIQPRTRSMKPRLSMSTRQDAKTAGVTPTSTQHACVVRASSRTGLDCSFENSHCRAGRPSLLVVIDRGRVDVERIEEGSSKSGLVRYIGSKSRACLIVN
jgi:hypothetical protein